MRAVRRPRARLLPGGGPGRGRESFAGSRHRGGAVGVRALVLGGARSGKSALAERLVGELGGANVLYVATAVLGDDPDLRRRVLRHRERRPASWGTVEAGDLTSVPGEAAAWDAVLLDSLTLWVAAQPGVGSEEGMLPAFDRFLEDAGAHPTPFVLVSDEVGLGVVPESEAGRVFRDALGLVNQRAAAAADEVHLCVTGVGVRIK